jgi:hypothetical protein
LVVPKVLSTEAAIIDSGLDNGEDIAGCWKGGRFLSQALLLWQSFKPQPILNS